MRIYSLEKIPEGTRRNLYSPSFLSGVLTGSGFKCYNNHYLYNLYKEDEVFILDETGYFRVKKHERGLWYSDH